MKSAALFLDGIATVINQCPIVPFEKTELALASLGKENANL